MMTERLYYRDATLLTFDAVVTRLEMTDNRCWLFLDRSAFYPTSGGQQHDLGTIDGHDVLNVLETNDGDVAHVMLSPEPYATGKPVRGVVDAERRLRNRQQHTAQHIVSQLFAQIYTAETVSVHLGAEYGAVELSCSSLDERALRDVERRANGVVNANRAVEVLFVSADQVAQLPLRKQPSREGTIRVIRIGDLDWSACGGTHCNATAEIRLIKLIGSEKMRGHLLVKFLSGEQAVDDYHLRFDITDRLAKLLTCHSSDLPAKSDSLIAENKELRKRIAQLQKELLPHRAKALAYKAAIAGRVQVVAELVPGCEPGVLSPIATLVAATVHGVAMLMSGDRVVIAVSESVELSADQLVQALCTSLGLRGGGSARVAQFGGADPSKLVHYRRLLLTLVHDA